MARAVTSPAFQKITALKWKELEKVLLRGETPDPGSMTGWEYRGMNIAPLARFLGLQKFIKGFYRNSEGEVFGYNLRVSQNGPEGEWLVKPPGSPKPFGFYRVEKVDPTSRDNRYLKALLLNYGKGGNRAPDPTGALRDYLVRVEKGSDELLLGKAYLAIGPLRLLLSYFVLERQNPAFYSG